MKAWSLAGLVHPAMANPADMRLCSRSQNNPFLHGPRPKVHDLAERTGRVRVAATVCPD